MVNRRSVARGAIHRTNRAVIEDDLLPVVRVLVAIAARPGEVVGRFAAGVTGSAVRIADGAVVEPGVLPVRGIGVAEGALAFKVVRRFIFQVAIRARSQNPAVVKVGRLPGSGGVAG